MTNLPPRRQPPPEAWGKWVLDRATWTLVFRDGNYWVDLADIRSSADMLDWIVQISQKTWATPQDIGHLVLALDEIFDAQAHLCGDGQDHRIENVPAFLRDWDRDRLPDW